MTTNRMGLTPEMALEISNERIDDEALAELIEFRRGSLDYHVKQGNKTQAFMHGMVLSALRELLAYREASKQTVAYIDELELNRIKDGDSGVIRTPIYGAGYQDASIPLYAAPPLQAVTVPDGWIKCIDRMPDVGDIALTSKDGCVNVGEMERSGANYRYFTSVISGRELPATHWMPLPTAPESVTNEP